MDESVTQELLGDFLITHHKLLYLAALGIRSHFDFLNESLSVCMWSSKDPLGRRSPMDPSPTTRKFSDFKLVHVTLMSGAAKRQQPEGPDFLRTLQTSLPL